jgi:hypothetical protein
MELLFHRFCDAVALGIGRIRQGNTGLFVGFGGVRGGAACRRLLAGIGGALTVRRDRCWPKVAGFTGFAGRALACRLGLSMGRRATLPGSCPPLACGPIPSWRGQRRNWPEGPRGAWPPRCGARHCLESRMALSLRPEAWRDSRRCQAPVARSSTAGLPRGNEPRCRSAATTRAQGSARAKGGLASPRPRTRAAIATIPNRGRGNAWHRNPEGCTAELRLRAADVLAGANQSRPPTSLSPSRHETAARATLPSAAVNPRIKGCLPAVQPRRSAMHLKKGPLVPEVVPAIEERDRRIAGIEQEVARLRAGR